MSTEARNPENTPQDNVVIPNTPYDGFEKSVPTAEEKAGWAPQQDAIRNTQLPAPEKKNAFAAFLQTKAGKIGAGILTAGVVAGVWGATHQSQPVSAERTVPGEQDNEATEPTTPVKPTDLPTTLETPTNPEQGGEAAFPGGLIDNDPNPHYADEETLSRAYRMNSDIISPLDRSAAIIRFTHTLEPRFEYPYKTDGHTIDSRKQSADIMVEEMFDGDAKDSTLATQLKTWSEQGTDPLEFLPLAPFSMDPAEVGGQPSQHVVIGGKFSYGNIEKAFQMDMYYKDDGNGNKGYVITDAKEMPVPKT